MAPLAAAVVGQTAMKEPVSVAVQTATLLNIPPSDNTSGDSSTRESKRWRVIATMMRSLGEERILSTSEKAR